MNNRVRNQRRAALMKYCCKIRGYTSPSQRGLALGCLLIDSMLIGAKAIIDDPKKRMAVNERLGL